MPLRAGRSPRFVEACSSFLPGRGGHRPPHSCSLPVPGRQVDTVLAAGGWCPNQGGGLQLRRGQGRSRTRSSRQSGGARVLRAEIVSQECVPSLIAAAARQAVAPADCCGAMAERQPGRRHRGLPPRSAAAPRPILGAITLATDSAVIRSASRGCGTGRVSRWGCPSPVRLSGQVSAHVSGRLAVLDAELGQHGRDVVIDCLGRDKQVRAIWALVCRSQINSSTVDSRGVSPSGCARVARRGPTGTDRAPIWRSFWRTRPAVALAPSSSSRRSASRSSSSSEESSSANGASRRQPSSSHARAAAV